MFNEKKANTAVRFIKLLKHTQGEFARKPFNLMPFQEKIVRELIGTLNEDGTRQYREAFIFLPRKNGKTELIAAMLVYFLFMDDEYGAEIYSCANDREQASKVFTEQSTLCWSLILSLSISLHIANNMIRRENVRGNGPVRSLWQLQ